MNRISLTKKKASIFARIALDGVIREYPNKPEHLFNSRADARTPRQLHPAFYGCYDWHSAVHSHWMLLRILRMFPGLATRSDAAKPERTEGVTAPFSAQRIHDAFPVGNWRT